MSPKLKSSITGTGGCGSSKGHVNNVHNKLNINEEYMEAFRTKSYMEICSNVQGHLRRTSTTKEEIFSSPLPSYTHLCDHLQEPQQEILSDMIKNCSGHCLRRCLVDYFDCSLEACKICGFLLQNVDQTRTLYSKIQKIIHLSNSSDQCGLISHELASFAKLANPLSSWTPVQFHQIHDRYELVLYQLTLTRKKIQRREKLIRLCKKAAGIAVTLALVTVSFGFLKWKMKSVNTSVLARGGAQLDAAAKGIYILNRDFDTVNRLVMRLYDEIEHGKDIAKMCVSNQNKQLLMEVVREFKINESCFVEKLRVLEEHIYLCFLTIKRARRLVLQEIMMP
ncbi:hypothetical protein NE237_024156 [Protea cynaroides]|uniref:Uncharacterized protein n=1 Tax=Protea cynaroides TaxID=273540 RepID=A0A9Q0K628_9MAGN|nr:hypothetical protein NE237_024156 [Protea cynaroides]